MIIEMLTCVVDKVFIYSSRGLLFILFFLIRLSGREVKQFYIQLGRFCGRTGNLEGILIIAHLFGVWYVLLRLRVPSSTGSFSVQIITLCMYVYYFLSCNILRLFQSGGILVSDSWVIDYCWVEADLKGSCHVVTEEPFLYLSGGTEKDHGKPHSG
jgi:hypothetical protein